MRRWSAVIGVWSLTVGTSVGQPLLTFDEAVAIALRGNPRIAVARNDAEIARNEVHVGNAGLLPRLDLSGSGTYQNSAPPSGTESDVSTTGARLSASYTLFDGLGNINRYRRLASGGRLGELEARARMEASLLAVANAYYGAAAASENLRIARRSLEISQERLTRARRRADYGQGGTVDVLAARVDFNSDTVAVVQAEFAWEDARRGLNTLLGRPITTGFSVEPSVVFAELEPLERMREMALRGNAAYLTAAESLEYARLGLRVASAAYLPQLDLSASYGYDQTDDGFNFSLHEPTRSWNVRATMSLDLFDGFQRRIERENATIQVRSQELLEQEARLELDQALISAHESYRNSRLILDLERRNLGSAQVNFRRTSELFGLGQVTSTQFREAQLNLIRAQGNVSTATYDAKLDEIELLRITGRLLTSLGHHWDG
jgi:outer membrane protein